MEGSNLGIRLASSSFSSHSSSSCSPHSPFLGAGNLQFFAFKWRHQILFSPGLFSSLIIHLWYMMYIVRILLGSFRHSLWRCIYTCYKFYTLHRECFVSNTVFSEFFLTRQTDTKLAEVQFSPRYWNGRRSLRSLPLHSLTRNPPFTAGGLSSKVINSSQWIIVQLWNGGKFGGVLLHDIREKFRCYISALLHTTARLIFWQPPPVVLDGAWRTS